jgi:hypothetical protein
MATFNHDFRELLAEFNVQRVEYIVVGAHALAAHGQIRATKDLDVWVKPDAANAARVLAALQAFGAALHGLTEEDLSTPGVVFQMGVPPVRIDILTVIDGVSFDEAWPERVQTKFAGVPTAVLSRKHLIKNKSTAGRPQDLADLAWLEAHDGDD